MTCTLGPLISLSFPHKTPHDQDYKKIEQRSQEDIKQIISGRMFYREDEEKYPSSNEGSNQSKNQ